MYKLINFKNLSKKNVLIIVDKKTEPDMTVGKKSNLFGIINAVILTVSTVVLAFATWGLYSATNSLVDITNKNIEVSNRMADANEDMVEQTKIMAKYTKRSIKVSEKMTKANEEVAEYTRLNIEVSKEMTKATNEMALQTGKMAEYTKFNTDTLIEQFKIKSYPSFFIDVSKSSITPEKYEVKMEVVNKGEITAYKTSALIVSVFERENGTLEFISDVTAYYNPGEKFTSLDYEKDFLTNTILKITQPNKYRKPYKMDDLKHLLIFLKYKIPFNDRYEYESYAWILRERSQAKKDNSNKIFQELNVKDSKYIINEFIKIIKLSNLNTMKSFFKDYEMD